MHAATTRSIIAAAGLAAIGLAFWPQHATPVAQQGIPTVHRDVALVDATVDAEITSDNAFWNSFLGPSGFEEQMFQGLGGGSVAEALLDTNTASPAFSGDFNGAESRFIEGLFVSMIASQDETNQLFGLETGTAETAAQAAFANDILNIEFVPIPHSIEPFTLEPGAMFDSELMTLAAAEFSSASGDFTGYLADLPTNLASLFGI